MRAVLPLLCLWSCATGGDPSVGGTALPNPGYAPYTVYAEDDAGITPVLEDPPGSDPMAYVTEGRLTLAFSQCPPDGPCRIMTTNFIISRNGTDTAPMYPRSRTLKCFHFFFSPLNLSGALHTLVSTMGKSSLLSAILAVKTCSC